MQRLLAGLVLALPLSAAALEGGISLGGAIKVDDPLFGHQSNAIDRLSGHLRFKRHWLVGVEGLYREDSRSAAPVFPNPLLAPNPILTPAVDRYAESVGLTLGYDYRFLPRHAIGVGGAAGLERLHYGQVQAADDVDKGRYHALFVYYDFFASEHFSIGISGRRQTDKVTPDAIPNTSCAVNCTGLNNVVYNPYAGLALNGNFKVRSAMLSINLGYTF